jgi:hypothetical protein
LAKTRSQKQKRPAAAGRKQCSTSGNLLIILNGAVHRLGIPESEAGRRLGARAFSDTKANAQPTEFVYQFVVKDA